METGIFCIHAAGAVSAHIDAGVLQLHRLDHYRRGARLLDAQLCDALHHSGAAEHDTGHAHAGAGRGGYIDGAGHDGRYRSLLLQRVCARCRIYHQPDPRDQCGRGDRIFPVRAAGRRAAYQQGQLYTAGGGTCDAVHALCISERDAQDPPARSEYVRGGTGSGSDTCESAFYRSHPADFFGCRIGLWAGGDAVAG